MARPGRRTPTPGLVATRTLLDVDRTARTGRARSAPAPVALEHPPGGERPGIRDVHVRPGADVRLAEKPARRLRLRARLAGAALGTVRIPRRQPARCACQLSLASRRRDPGSQSGERGALPA